MARSKNTHHRPSPIDLRYVNSTVAKLINRSMRSGKKSVAQSQIYQALNLVKTKTSQDPLEILEIALKNITPQMEVRSRRVGGAAYQVPMPVKTHRGSSLAIRWLVIEAGKRSNKEYHTYAEKLAAELIDASQNQGGAVQKKVTSHKMAEANKAFAHFRW
jgi:small subunit ribosomal protein S7